MLPRPSNAAISNEACTVGQCKGLYHHGGSVYGKHPPDECAAPLGLPQMSPRGVMLCAGNQHLQVGPVLLGQLIQPHALCEQVPQQQPDGRLSAVPGLTQSTTAITVNRLALSHYPYRMRVQTLFPATRTAARGHEYGEPRPTLGPGPRTSLLPFGKSARASLSAAEHRSRLRDPAAVPLPLRAQNTRSQNAHCVSQQAGEMGGRNTHRYRPAVPPESAEWCRPRLCRSRLPRA